MLLWQNISQVTCNSCGNELKKSIQASYFITDISIVLQLFLLYYGYFYYWLLGELINSKILEHLRYGKPIKLLKGALS